jgi:NADPH-dependent F420 reductase
MRIALLGGTGDIGADLALRWGRDMDHEVVAVPPEYAVETVATDLSSTAILVSPAVSMVRDTSGFHYARPETGSIAEAIAAAAPEDVSVVSAFQNLAARALSTLDDDLALDVVVTGDDADAKTTVSGFVNEIDGLRALDAGGLANSAEVESVTPLLINLAMNNDGLHDLGVRFQ